MGVRDEVIYSSVKLYEFCKYPAVRYKILFSLLDVSYEDKKLGQLRPDFFQSDIVEELYQTQDMDGGWGDLFSKDYSVKAKIPTSCVGIERSLYIGLTIEDRDILFLANDYLESFLEGKNRKPLYNKNERAIPWQMADICNLIESIKPYNSLCDEIYNEWKYIAERSFWDGEYSYERERAAQHEVFSTREDRLVPMRFALLLRRRDQITPDLEDAMLRTYGATAFQKGFFWDNCPSKLPDKFCQPKMNRWFRSFNYINQFRGSHRYLEESVEWLLSQRQQDGLWDWGPQIKDPWGYFNYFSCNRHYAHNRIVNGTLEVLYFLKQYADHNEKYFFPDKIY